MTYTPAHREPVLKSAGQVAQEAAIAAAQLVEQWPDHFLGSNLTEDGTVLLAVSDDEGRRLASVVQRAFPLVHLEDAGVSWTKANALSEELRTSSNFLYENVHTWGASARNLGVFVQVQQDVPAEERAVIDDFARKHNIPISVEVVPMSSEPLVDSRDHDTSPYAGGGKYEVRREDGSYAGDNFDVCSSGYGYKIGTGGYMLTAGHCFPSNGTHNWMWAAPNAYERAGKVAATTYKQGNGFGTFATGLDNANHGDLAVVAVGANNKVPGYQIWWGGVSTTNKIPVTGREAPAGGVDICFSGQRSGSDCGTVISLTNVNWTYDNGETVKNGDRGYATNTVDCPQLGDSGGAVVRNHVGTETQAQAIGIVSGRGFNGLGDCFIYFTGVEEANQAWGGDLKYQP